MTNIHEVNDLVDFLEEHNITAQQFLYCLLLHYDKQHSRIEGSHKISRPLSKVYKYHQNIDTFKKKDIQDLEDKGFIDISGDQLKLDMIEVTDKFKKKWLGDKFKFDDVKDAYPMKMPNFDHPSKPDIPLNALSDYHKTKDLYNKFVGTYKMHRRVLDLIEWGKENDKIRVGLEKFVNSKYWENLQKMRSDDEGSMKTHTVI